MNSSYWGIQIERKSGFEWAFDSYWDGEGQLSFFSCQWSAEKRAKELEKRTNCRTRVRELKYDK